jgi:hypothetical protein
MSNLHSTFGLGKTVIACCVGDVNMQCSASAVFIFQSLKPNCWISATQPSQKASEGKREFCNGTKVSDIDILSGLMEAR